jgi:predicted RND superfamily exporter protein
VATRIRPIFMTTAAMVFGMLPVAMGLGSAGEMKSAMGIVLIGGLVFSMVVTMIIVPVAFLSVDKLRSKVMGNKTATTIQKNRGGHVPVDGQGRNGIVKGKTVTVEKINA